MQHFKLATPLLGIGDVSVRYDGNIFFVFSPILSPSNAPYEDLFFSIKNDIQILIDNFPITIYSAVSESTESTTESPSVKGRLLRAT